MQLLNNSIYGNSWSTANGGGVSLFAAGNPVLKNNLITNNNAGSQGGGISMLNRSDALIEQNIVAGNSASSGGGVYWLVPSGARGPLMVNNTVAGNHAQQGSAVLADGFETIEADLPAVVTISNELGAARKPTLRETMRAARKPLTVKSASELGLLPAEIGGFSARRVRERLYVPVRSGRCEIIPGADEAAQALELARRLRSARLV